MTKTITNRQTILIAIGIILLITFNLYMFRDVIFYRPNDDLKVVDVKDFSGIENLKLTGEVYEVVDNIGNYNGTGIIRVNVIKSNVEEYDPRANQANYYCIIKKNKAEFYLNNLSKYDIGDTISINIPKDEAKVFNNSKQKNKKMGLRVYPRRFFDFIKRKGYQKI